MKKLFITLVCAASAALAQPAPTDDALWRDLGGTEGIRALADRFVEGLFADARIRAHFKETKPAFLKQQLADQFCQLAGGPCVYDGETMKKAHAELHITRADFNALVEDLQDAMDARAIPFATQRRLLALLAPMHREIVEAR